MRVLRPAAATVSARAAILEADYRYRLHRAIGGSMFGPGGTVLFCMCNPSTATATQDDPTIRRCMGFARDWGHERLAVVNLFAARATDPRDMLRVYDPVGPENDSAIMDEAIGASAIVVAWGEHGCHDGRGAAVLRMLQEAGPPVLALGLTATGQPRHPLYVRADTSPLPIRSIGNLVAA